MACMLYCGPPAPAGLARCSVAGLVNGSGGGGRGGGGTAGRSESGRCGRRGATPPRAAARQVGRQARQCAAARARVGSAGGRRWYRGVAERHAAPHMQLWGTELRGLVDGVLGVVSAARAGLAGLAGLVAGPPTLVLVGLDSSGKTTALLRLKYGHYVNAVPTVGFNCERLRRGGASWVAWDVGGAERVRPLWRAYTRGADAVLFVVDTASGADRLEEARHELHALVRRQAAQSAALRRPRPPLLVLANKQDLPGARTPAATADALGLHDLPPAQPWGLSAACAVTGEGLPEAMDLLRRLLLKSRRASLPRA